MTPNAARAAEALEAVDRLQVRAYTDIRDEWKDLGLLRAALSQPAAWVAVDVEKPKPGAPVLAFYRNALGKGRTIRAQWSDGKSLEMNDASECEAIYDEANDCYWVKEGWFEWNEHEEVCWAVDDGPVTHWMPLPPAPAAAPEMSTLATEKE